MLLKTINTQKNENWRLGLIKYLHIQKMSFARLHTPLSPVKVVFDFQSNKHRPTDPKGKHIHVYAEMQLFLLYLFICNLFFNTFSNSPPIKLSEIIN